VTRRNLTDDPAAPGAAPLRLRRRLTIAFILVAALAAAVLATGSYLFIQRSWLLESQQRGADDTRRQLALAEQFLPDPDRAVSLPDSFARSGRDVVVVVAGVAHPSNPAVAPTLPDRLRTAVAGGELAYQRLDHGGRPLLVIGGRIGGSPDQLYVIFSEEQIERDLRQLRAVLLAGAVAVTALAAAVGYALARRTLEPVSRASAAAHALAEGLLETRLPAGSRDEFGAWAHAFNRMAAALAAKIEALSRAQERERRFTADVAHELRTPVTALVAEASLLRAELAQIPPAVRRPTELLLADVVRLRHLVDELMEISRLDGEQEAVHKQPVDVAELVAAVVVAGGWQERVRVSGPAGPAKARPSKAGPSKAGPSKAGSSMAGPALVVETDPRRLQRVVTNLLANALEHGAPPVEVALRTGSGTVILAVADHGPGIAPEHLPRLFDRFYKVDASRSGPGSGLGLAIARENARLLGGDIEVTSRPGAGTEFRVTLRVTRLLPAGEAAVEFRTDGEPKTAPEGGRP
jgi:two-component system sensor histidine kinase MtrB